MMDAPRKVVANSRMVEESSKSAAQAYICLKWPDIGEVESKAANR